MKRVKVVFDQPQASETQRQAVAMAVIVFL